MTDRIIYQLDDGGVAVIIPTPDGLNRAGGDIHKLAKKDVPAGKPYAVVSVSDLPGRTDRDAWTVEIDDLTDGIGGASNAFQD